ncbi:uncharacterized protein F4812DRAFT_258762 [Daldinia caldariorum]|uniref:uncharacterized protein n=1 Tax=Daldinia caldariorum TaxID=326644 RepID=UPI0020087E3D|nr:uncharacterized protein F4812DRAFT_258762 [Daldinia caldariorum]KAI1470264.1 hypothetical protein F4812DRAFT_258762 [Daldinia caldariorum]
MRPRIFNYRFISGRYHCLHKRNYGSHLGTAEKISLALSTKVPKPTVINELSKHSANSSKSLAKIQNVENSGYGAAIFASRDFATWLEDESFVSGVLESLFKGKTTGQDNSAPINVLCAVTDALTPKRLFSEPQTGLSILYGSADGILPGLWSAEDSESNISQDRESSVSFLSNPLPRDTRPLEITLPLANTIFQNGRRSTLFASRWQRDHGGSILRTMIHEKKSQRICLRAISGDHINPILPLLPLTPPRKIIAGLGNIVRQVEVNGTATPASKELEAIIPKVFDKRSERDASYSPGPIGVWCWVIPPDVVEKRNLLDLKVFEPGSSQSEAELSLEVMNVFSELLSSGCRLHKILSGGGGWGAKQGLLSLDQEISYSLPDQDDIELFIRAFQERNNPNSSEGLVRPGSYLMFCIEPHWPKNEIGLSREISPTTTIGVVQNSDQELDSAELSDKVDVIDGHFGVASKTGLFLKATNLAHVSQATEQPHAFTTKVDLPRASFIL